MSTMNLISASVSEGSRCAHFDDEMEALKVFARQELAKKQERQRTLQQRIANLEQQLQLAWDEEQQLAEESHHQELLVSPNPRRPR